MSYVLDLVSLLNSGGLILAALLGILAGDAVSQMWRALKG